MQMLFRKQTACKWLTIRRTDPLPPFLQVIFLVVILAVVQSLNHAAFAQSAIVETATDDSSHLPADWHKTFTDLAADYCIDCHNASSMEGGLDLTSIGSNLEDLDQVATWIRIYDRLAQREMPPDEANPLPEQQRETLLASLSNVIADSERARATVVLRRLNRNEYENTVRDLFGIQVDVLELLPEDTSLGGFDNIGEGLYVSTEAMQAYLRAAEHTLDVVFGPAQPPERIEMTTNLLDQKAHDGSSYIDRFIGTMFRRTDNGLVIFQSGYCPSNLVNFARRRPPAGTYRVTMNVRAIQSDGPVTLRVYGGDTIVGRREKHVVGYFDVPPDEWSTIEFEDRLVESGGTFQPKCYGTRDTRRDADTYPEPGIEIGDITIVGPLEEWPPPSRHALLGVLDLESANVEDAEAILSELTAKAFRRPVGDDELQPYLGLISGSLDSGSSFEDAIRLGIQAVLCSPQFLFLDEPAIEESADEAIIIDSFAVASRLSYFLWSSMPDDELFDLARDGSLLNEHTLAEQVERMLNDERSTAFTENFTGQWLGLRDIDFTAPDSNLYPEFDELLQRSMVQETQLFFSKLIEDDLNVMNIVDSDFTFLNQRLAYHYGINGISGQEFRKVDLPDDSVRGGFLTQASILKVTANGTNTSPVIRGAWVLDRILGTPSPPPPDNVGSVEPDIRGATTLRDQLRLHRDVSSCAVCHNRIDPPGFALESFDAIGGWRDSYRTLGEGIRPDFSQAPYTYAWVRYRIGLPVDPSGSTEDGQSFAEINEFKQWLLQQQAQVSNSFARRLMTYALGRELRFSDRPEIDAIVSKWQSEQLGVRSLVHLIVASEAFRRP